MAYCRISFVIRISWFSSINIIEDIP